MRWLLILALTGCANPVTLMHWTECQEECDPDQVAEACVTLWSGRGCTCDTGETIWIDH